MCLKINKLKSENKYEKEKISRKYNKFDDNVHPSWTTSLGLLPMGVSCIENALKFSLHQIPQSRIYS